MVYYVYLILSKKLNKYRSYVGYTNSIEKRLYLHNNSKGAKFTRGNTWKLIYFKKYNDKIQFSIPCIRTNKIVYLKYLFFQICWN